MRVGVGEKNHAEARGHGPSRGVLESVSEPCKIRRAQGVGAVPGALRVRDGGQRLCTGAGTGHGARGPGGEEKWKQAGHRTRQVEGNSQESFQRAPERKNMFCLFLYCLFVF